jgi:hypothetical protein
VLLFRSHLDALGNAAIAFSVFAWLLITAHILLHLLSLVEDGDGMALLIALRMVIF